MIRGLKAFKHGQIQDALNILAIMEKESLTKDDLRKHIEKVAFSPPKKARRGFLKRTTKADREALQAQRGLAKRLCKSCDEKRRGKK